MTESSKEARKNPTSRPNRWGAGTVAVVQTCLLAIIVIGLNYLSFHHYLRWDLSRGADYSLSSSSTRYLGSGALRDRAKPVRMIMAYRRTSPFYERVRALVSEYERRSDDRVTVEIVDPLRSPDRMQEVNAAYGLTLVRDLVIIDARVDQSAVTTEDAAQVRTLNPNIRIVSADDLAVYTTTDGKRKISGFQGEDMLTSRLVEAIEGKPRKMALITDKSRVDDGDPQSPHKSLENILRLQNVEFTPLHIAGLTDIPADVSAVLLIAPKYDFTDEELAVLDRYWRKPKSAVLVMIDGGEAPPKLRGFLRANGIAVHKDRLVSTGRDGLVSRARGVFTRGVDFTRDLAGLGCEFGGASSSLEVREGEPAMLERNVFPMSLIQVQDGFWGETDYGKGGEAFDEKDDYKAPLHLAACVIRGAENDDRFAADSSRMVVISNTDFLSPRNHSAENLDFLASSTHWMVGREALSGVGPRSLGVYKLPLLDAQVSFINRINLFFLPAFLLVVAAFVWNLRRV